jgi:sugar/nucleoside kinase (ribokinase family)
MAMRFDVIVVGDYCLDLIFMGLPSAPQPGREVVADAFDMVPGGTCNTALALHRLGVSVGWAGDFGTDAFSQQILAQARAEGLDERLFVRHDRSLRRVTVSASFPGDRTFIAYYDPDPTVPAGLKALAKASARLVYVPGLYTGSAFKLGTQLMRTKGMRLVMDGNTNVETSLADPKVRQAIQAAEIFLPNRAEALRLSGETDLERALSALGGLCPLVVVKDGAQGAFAIQSGQVIHAPAIPVKPLDTTGAGDAFNAGFLKAWLSDLPLPECLRWGNIVGGLSTLGPGGTGKVIREPEVREWLREGDVGGKR